MAKFTRKLESTTISALNAEDLWNNQLKNDCISQDVFFAIRNNDICFYHKGGRLFRFDEKKGFKTHVKFASVIDNSDMDYLTEIELKSKDLISDFRKNHNGIKKNCALYSGIEAQGVSEVYRKYSYLSSNEIVVLDIEVSFETIEKKDGQKQDRIDILLFNTKTRTLKFVEAKHFSNSEIWSKKTPKVINQIEKYERQIAKKEKDIIAAYTEYIDATNNIFNVNLPFPEKVNNKVTLLIFGFDRNQQSGRLKDLIITNDAFKNIEVFALGDITKIKLENIRKLNK